MLKLTPASTNQKNIMATISEVIQGSRRLGQVTLRASARTSLANCGRLVRFFGVASVAADGDAMTAAVFAARSRIACGRLPDLFAMAALRTLASGCWPKIYRYRGLRRWWQEWRDSNPRPSVLETDALPAELHS